MISRSLFFLLFATVTQVFGLVLKCEYGHDECILSNITLKLERDKKLIEFVGTPQEKSKVQKLDFVNSRVFCLHGEIRDNFPNLFSISFTKGGMPFTLGKLFLDSPFDKIKSFSISYTKHIIQNIRDDTFARLPELQHFGMTGNRIEKIEPAFLRNGKKLISIGMQDNDIMTFPTDLFNGLQNVKYLFLQGNGLTHLDVNFFKDSNSLESIDLSNNALQLISPNTFDGLPKLKFLIMHWAKCVDAAYGPDDVQDKLKNDPNFKKCHKV